ncbi:MAG: helix-turn-helix domain-containing protein [Patescibacteria group bacterium]
MNGFVSHQLGKRRSLGSVLKTARSKAEVSLEQAETATKIPLKYLSALETGNYNRLPAEAYNLGYVRCYAEYLHLDPDKIISSYKAERAANWHQSDISTVSFSPKKAGDWQFLITPKLLGIVGLVALFGGIGLYITSELNKFTSVPTLEVTSVPAEFTSDKDQITLAGSTSGGVILTVNSEPVFVTPDGQFSQLIQLNPGVNEIVLQAKNRAEKVSLKTVKVLYNPNLAKTASPATKE